MSVASLHATMTAIAFFPKSPLHRRHVTTAMHKRITWLWLFKSKTHVQHKMPMFNWWPSSRIVSVLLLFLLLLHLDLLAVFSGKDLLCVGRLLPLRRAAFYLLWRASSGLFLCVCSSRLFWQDDRDGPARCPTCPDSIPRVDRARWLTATTPVA